MMNFCNSVTSFIFVIILLTLKETSAKPTALHENLKFPCGENDNELGIKGEINELAVWKSIHFIAHDIHNSVKQIREHQNDLPCKNAPSLPIDTLNKLNDLSQIKVLREASKAAYHDLMNIVAHFNIIVDVQKCWDETLEKKIRILRNKMLPVICSINGILEADAEILLKEVLALKIMATNPECSYHATVTCTLLDHVQDLANGLVKFNVPS